jgi:HSP90 family molecular chaperone
LISNANDALERLRYVQLAAGNEQVEDDQREIHITVDDINRTLTIKVR